MTDKIDLDGRELYTLVHAYLVRLGHIILGTHQVLHEISILKDDPHASVFDPEFRCSCMLNSCDHVYQLTATWGVLIYRIGSPQVHFATKPPVVHVPGYGSVQDTQGAALLMITQRIITEDWEETALEARGEMDQEVMGQDVAVVAQETLVEVVEVVMVPTIILKAILYLEGRII
ncbi:hypothetical protein PLEOSDRAFT_1084851 [Pleurotus ostreatus PC15]|uniref:Uncharacterized protein n=1 Tax=Pleurotus ostreatus (strain PC15) TaxID=1137138 RepID=A0A067NM82_PLEO1|nr:hypothetical protein PLEOSDRAFT_1084851 [Pleurotus ostreatus PC15]